MNTLTESDNLIKNLDDTSDELSELNNDLEIVIKKGKQVKYKIRS